MLKSVADLVFPGCTGLFPRFPDGTPSSFDRAACAAPAGKTHDPSGIRRDEMVRRIASLQSTDAELDPHVVVVGRDFLMQTMRCVSEQVAVLVYGAALPRHVAPEGGQCLPQPSAAVDDQELWLAQPALDELPTCAWSLAKRAL